ncbi:MAG: hypothetical protein COC04_02900 [Gammaproteobacteria bacterium]|nr:MAG: hypothetical protein COC04_02900 [Gammaproteobacteria bacterium]
MALPSLFKRRQVWLPTFWGLIIFTVVIATVLNVVFRNIGYFLAQDQPINGQYLVVEGWLAEPALLTAITQFKQGGYQLLITTGGPDNRHVNPLHATYAEQASAFLVKHGINTDQLITIPTPASAQDRTYLSAVMVKDWFSENKPGHATIDLYSGDVHARRSYSLYKMAFADKAHIGIIAAEPNNFSLQHWWRTSEGAKSVLAETAGLVWINCCFSPGDYGSHQEKWGMY